MSAPSAMHEAARFAALTAEADRLRILAAERIERGTAVLEKAIAVQHHDLAAARTYVEMSRRTSAEGDALMAQAAKLDRESLR